MTSVGAIVHAANLLYASPYVVAADWCYHCEEGLHFGLLEGDDPIGS